MLLALLPLLALAEQPVLPLRLAALGDWPTTDGTLHYGDVRAVVNVEPANAASTAPVTAQVFWRRRDAHPATKGIFVTDSRGNAVAQSSPPLVSGACGAVSFVPTGDTTYHIYYLGYHQHGGGANLHFSW